MMKSRTIIGVSKKMQTAVRHLASLLLFFSLFTFVFSLFTTSCYREPLELYKQGDSKVTIVYDWSEFGKEPAYVFVMYYKDGNTLTNGYQTSDVTGETNERMPNGTYQKIVMTYTPTDPEYEGNMRFLDVNDFEKARVQSEYYNITSQDAWDKGMRYMEQPKELGIAIDSFEVNMNNDGLQFYEYNKGDDIDTLNQQRQDTIRPMTTTLKIIVKVRGINYIQPLTNNRVDVDGYITGMANGCSLSQFWRSTEVGNIKLNNEWKISDYKSTSNTRSNRAGEMEVGYIETTISTFGLPHGRELQYQRTPNSNYLMLHFISLDPVANPRVEFAYNIGKIISYLKESLNDSTATFTQRDVAQPLELVIDAPAIAEDDLPIMPYAQPKGSGQFDAQVEDWGDDQNVDVPM